MQLSINTRGALLGGPMVSIVVDDAWSRFIETRGASLRRRQERFLMKRESTSYEFAAAKVTSMFIATCVSFTSAVAQLANRTLLSRAPECEMKCDAFFAQLQWNGLKQLRLGHACNPDISAKKGDIQVSIFYRPLSILHCQTQNDQRLVSSRKGY